MPITDETGQWLIRKQETALGNLVAESFRHDVQAQIGLTNAGGVRNGLKAGDVTYADAISVVPYDNAVCLIEATGLQIQNMLEACTASYPQLDGDFPQLSGLKFTLHVSDHSVSDVMVYDEQSNTFVPVTADGIYTIGTLDYFATGGFYGTLKDCPLLNEPSKICYDVLADYMEHTLHGVIPDAYRQPAGLITIVE
jgi:2',3'-cyclic-nucleotide 2'-phosphodiesterase (5'-nucleotidase family)